MCLCSYGVSVHESPDPGGNFTGKQDNQAGEELQDTYRKLYLTGFCKLRFCLLNETNQFMENQKVPTAV